MGGAGRATVDDDLGTGHVRSITVSTHDRLVSGQMVAVRRQTEIAGGQAARW
jgi:hypothetical protein